MSLRAERGLTLVEVVTATAIFAIVVTALTGFFMIASARGLLGRDVTSAVLLAHQRVDFLESKSYASLSGYAATETLDSLGNSTASGPFTRVTAITTPVLGTSLLTEIDVTVSWMEQTVPRSVVVSTLVASY